MQRPTVMPFEHLIAFLLHPWTLLIRSMQCVPRSLADDLLVYGVGPEHAAKVQNAYQATFSYLHTLGAKVSATKFFLFSTCAATRELFRQRYWAHLGTRIQVYMSRRYHPQPAHY